MKNLLIGNPIIQRYRFSLMRPRQFGIYLVSYLIILMLLLFINVAAEASAGMIFTEIIVFQIILVLWAAHNSSTAIRDEMTDKTYDFFRMLPLSAHQKANGILIGKNVVALLFLAVNMVFMIAFGIKAVRPYQLGQVVLVLACGAFCINAVALLSSNISTGPRRRRSNIGLLILLIFMIGPMLGGIGAFHESEWGEEIAVPFYNMSIPVLLFMAAITLYCGVWSYWGTIRKFVKENECLFARFWAVLFLVGSELIILGLFVPHLREGTDRPVEVLGPVGPEMNHVFWAVTLAPLLLISLGSIRTFDKYWDKSLMFAGRGRSAFMGGMFVFSNTGLGVLLFVIWTAFAVGFGRRAGMAWAPMAGTIGVLLLSYLFFVLLIELWALYRPDSEKIAILLGVIAAVYLVLPLICAVIFEVEMLVVGSPLGLFGYLLAEDTLSTDWLMGLLAYHVVVCAVPVIKVLQQWGRIREVRGVIDKQRGGG